MSTGSVNIASLNIGELHLEKSTEIKFAKICAFLEDQNVGICFLQETRLNDNQIKSTVSNMYESVWSKCYSVSGYQHAGTAILISKRLKLSFKEIVQFKTAKQLSENISFDRRVTAVKVDLGGNKHLYLINVYAPARDNFGKDNEKAFKQFFQPFCEIVKNILVNVKSNDSVIVAGDMNQQEVFFKETPEYFVKNQLEKLGLQMLQKGVFNEVVVNRGKYEMTYIYQKYENRDSQLPKSIHAHRYDYIFVRGLSNNVSATTHFVEIKLKIESNPADEETLEKTIQQIKRVKTTPSSTFKEVINLTAKDKQFTFTANTLDMTFSDKVFSQNELKGFFTANGKYFIPHFLLMATFPIR